MHELAAADMEEYRKKIVERDKNKDEDVAEERRIVVERDVEKAKGGERSKFEGEEKTGEARERLERGNDNDKSDLHRVPSPPAVFTFDQEDIQTSKLLSFEKVSNDQIIPLATFNGFPSYPLQIVFCRKYCLAPPKHKDSKCLFNFNKRWLFQL